MSKKEQNIMIYLRKDSLAKYQELARITKQPVSRVIAQALQETHTLDMIDNLIEIFSLLKVRKGGEDLNGRQ